jgi:hypothetical protein
MMRSVYTTPRENTIRGRARTDYRAKAEEEVKRAFAYPEGQPNQAAYTHIYRAALQRALRHARTAVIYGQMTEADRKRFKKRVEAIWK